MTRTLTTVALAAALAAGAGCSKDAAGELSIPWRPPQVGDRATQVQAVTMRLDVTVPGEAGPIALVQREDETRHLAVLAVEGGHASRVEVHYELARQTQSLAGDEIALDAPHHGRTYLAWLEGGELRLTDHGGGAVAGEELEAVTADLADELGRAPGMAQVITRRRWRVGTKVTLTSDELVLLGDPRKGTVAHAGTITLSGVAGGVATFAAEIDAETRAPSGAMRTPSRLTFEIDTARSRVLRASVTAALDGEVDGTRATGEMTATMTTTWR